MELVDSHCHLMALDKPVGDVLSTAEAAGVRTLINVGSINGTQSAYQAVQTAEKFPQIFAAVGIHPHDAKDHVEVEELKPLAFHPRVVAIGETGLDFYRDWSPKDRQLELFKNTIRLALEVGKPLIVHCREALEETLETLRDFGAGQVGGVFHCYSGDTEFAGRLRSLNFIVSFPGTVTFKNAHRVQEAAAAIPLEQIMLETDCPYMAPEPYRGMSSEPAHVRQIAEKIAELKNLDLETVARVTTGNARRLFRLS